MKARLAAVALVAAVGTASVGYLQLTSDHVAAFEGIRHTAYQDSAGVWTICYGHTRGVREGMTATREQCEQWLLDDLHEADAIVSRCMPNTMSDKRRAAFISFAYNVGPGAKGVKDGLCVLRNGSKPYIRRMAEQGRWQEACDGLLAWTKAGGVELRGLVKRRHSERELCLAIDFGNVRSGVAHSVEH